MNVLLLLIPLALMLALGFMAAFIWASKNGQWDDLDLPQRKMLLDQLQTQKKENHEPVK